MPFATCKRMGCIYIHSLLGYKQKIYTFRKVEMKNKGIPPPLKEFLKTEGIALRKDLTGGILITIAALIVFFILERLIFFIGIFTGAITSAVWLEILLGFLLILLFGIGARKLTKWKFFKKILPTEIVKKPEVAYADSKGVFRLGILISTHHMCIGESHIEVGEVMPAQASPTSWGSLSGELIPTSELWLTGRTQGDVLLSCASLGAKTKEIIHLKKYEHSS
jgi:hypothetical protein